MIFGDYFFSASQWKISIRKANSFGGRKEPETDSIKKTKRIIGITTFCVKQSKSFIPAINIARRPRLQ